MNTTKNLIQKLYDNSNLSRDEFTLLIDNIDENDYEFLFNLARKRKEEYYDKSVFMRALIEFTNYCKQNCNYCGIRASNSKVERYRLSKEQILECSDEGYRLGYRSFVMQGGEDPFFSDDLLCDIVKSIKYKYPDVAITLSVGEKSMESYKKLKEAGTDRYLLRHETASKELYESLHPNMSFDNRRNCLFILKELGYQVGAGFMVGLPNQKTSDFVNDLEFLKELNPEMIGIGPFIPHEDTPLGSSIGGTVEKTLVMVAITRLLLPSALLPSTTALGTLDSKGREKALKAGANVVMPNLSPTNVRELYELYKDKICTGDEAAHCRKCIEVRINSTGYSVDMGRGDHSEWGK
ncbi:[FeFe] hydrogenase H-cluster radical SAM maturase HydE [Tissierella creatinophila]|uniref:Biotin synthase n=1 Tax=Tissierella creatinophila DSM 6911 TaxID=1123403 RepID=A0A1U7M907_TISCR|nr:[FeFe] hydrogenase H-cluster radical SAM maturase HydE [Tissierella creatinophila]OLS03824.1 biotin synthase [Tissierella creatinophila DSM 6911]